MTISLKLSKDSQVFVVDTLAETAILALIRKAVVDEHLRCCGVLCEGCRDGYTATESARGRFVHLADLQPPSLPKIYFDSECDASALRASPPT